MRKGLFVLVILFCSFTGTGYLVREQHFKFHSSVSKDENTAFSRDSILNNLKYKIQKKEPLVVHILVPLCDNENQGIVPVNTSLGNGFNPTTNLYWGAAYGIKTYFRKKADWKMISSVKPESEVILERLVFRKDFANGAKVFLIADAYRGDKMKNCLQDFFQMLAGKKREDVTVDNQNIASGSDADLVVFNGHNGLMDMDLSVVQWTGRRRMDAAAIGCYSHSYFKSHFLKSGAFPVLTTTHLMAPEAYVAEALINSWASLEKGEDIRLQAAKAYNTWQKCGMKGAMNLFKTGW